MRLHIKIFLLAFAPFIVCCNKQDDLVSTQDIVGSSRVTYFPVLTVKGNPYIAVPVGGTYTEPGVTAVAGGASIPVTTTGTVNTSAAGIYLLTYSAVNKDGYSATATRTAVVYSTAADAAANDFSGTYARTSNGVVSTWTKLAPGVYSVLNPGGAAGSGLTVVAINPSGLTIKIPAQRTNDGNITSSTTESYSKTPPATYSWVIVNPGYGTALRTFVKQ